MAIAHICHNCGTDLSHIHPMRDPHYELMIILCPNCGKGCVRIMHSFLRSLRKPKKVINSAFVLILQIFILLLCALSATFIILTIAHDFLLARTLNDFLISIWPYSIIQFVVMSFLVGSWLSAGLAHLSFWKSRMIWCLITAAIITYIVLGIKIINALDPPQSATTSYNPWSTFGDSLYEFLYALVILFFALVLTSTSAPLGKVFVRLFQVNRTIRWCKRRAKLRSRRNS